MTLKRCGVLTQNEQRAGREIDQGREEAALASERIGIGMVGANLDYGFGVKAHIPALVCLPEYRLAAVCNTSLDSARATATKFGIPLAVADPCTMIQDPGVDLVTVCVRVPAHYDLVRLAIDAGKHVYCEWPLGTNLAQFEELRDLAVKRNVANIVGLQGRGSPAINFMKDLVHDGFVGEVVSCTMVATISDAGQRPAFNIWAYADENGAGTAHIPAGHSLDLLCYVVADFAELSANVAVQVKQATVADTGEVVDITTPDQVVVNGILRNGAVASAHIQTAPSAKMGLHFQVCGTEGMLVATGGLLWMQEIELHGLRRPMKNSEAAYNNAWGYFGSHHKIAPMELSPVEVPDRYRLVPATVPGGFPLNVAQLYRKLSAAILDGSSGHPDFQVAARRAVLLDTIRRSARERQVLPVA